MSKVLKTDLAFDLKPHSTRRTYSRERKLETDGLDHSSAQGPAASQRVNPRGVFTHKDTALHGDTQVGKILLMIGSLFIMCAQVPVSEGLNYCRILCSASRMKVPGRKDTVVFTPSPPREWH